MNSVKVFVVVVSVMACGTSIAVPSDSFFVKKARTFIKAVAEKDCKAAADAYSPVSENVLGVRNRVQFDRNFMIWVKRALEGDEYSPITLYQRMQKGIKDVKVQNADDDAAEVILVYMDENGNEQNARITFERKDGKNWYMGMVPNIRFLSFDQDDPDFNRVD